MKRTINLTLIFLTIFGMNTACISQTDEKHENTATTNIEKTEVFYFHFSNRCATCRAVESVSKESVKELYGNKVSFTGYNLDEQDGEIKGNELKVSGQTLLIVKGNTKIDLTNEGFLYARSNPEKLKQIIKDKIDPLL